MRTPARLRAGSVVAVVAPAGPVPVELLDHGVRVLESWGLRVMIGEHVADHDPRLGYLAGTDTDRAGDFRWAWCHPEVEAVFCARGGYGCLRMAELIGLPELKVGPRILIGASDVTVLHEAVAVHCGLPTIFGPMVATEAFGDSLAVEHLRRTLFEPDTVRRLRGPRAATMVPGRARGITVGGNANLLASTLGSTGSRVPPPGAIVLLEDITEQPYRLDRILTQLRRAGWFSEAGGIALGSWTDCGDPDEVDAVVTDVLGGLGLPMVGELGFGHCPGALTVPLGVPAELDADTATLTVLEPALAA